MKVTCIICTRNPELKFLYRAIDSAINQVNQLIIVDDNSKVPITKNLNIKYKSNKFILIRNENNIGLTRSLVKAIPYAKNELIARLDDDDYWHPDKIKLQLNEFTKNPQLVLIGTCYFIKRKNIVKKGNEVLTTNFRKILMKENPIVHSSAVFSKAIYFAAGGYDSKFKYSQDFDLWERMSNLGKCKVLKIHLTYITYKNRFNYSEFKKLIHQYRNSFKISSRVIKKEPGIKIILFIKLVSSLFFNFIKSLLILVFSNN